MSIQYDLDSISALELFYGGEYRGVYKGDFIKNEKKRGLILPPMLREFLEKFGYLSVNAGGMSAYRIFHPDDMAAITLPSDEGEIHLIVIGSLRVIKQGTENEEEQYFIAVRPDTPDLQMAMGQESDDGRDWWGTGRTLPSLLNIMFLSVLGKSCDTYVFDKSDEIGSVLARHGALLTRIRYAGDWASVHFDEQRREFLITEFDESGEICGLRVCPLNSGGEDGAKDLTAFSLGELEELFSSEFYGNAMHCDFSRALDILTEIIGRMEKSGAGETEFVRRFLLAGRCCWALGRLDEAEQWYGKGAEIAERHIAEDYKPVYDIYIAMANFFGDTGHPKKSAEMYDKAAAVIEKYDPGNCYDLGMIYRNRAMVLDADGGQPDEIIELCDKALELFQRDPRDSGCKYETARVRQLRGNARRRKKELGK